MALFLLIYMHVCMYLYVKDVCVHVETERQKEKEQQRQKDKEGRRELRRERLLPFSSKFLVVEDIPYETEVL